jgi:hypothetical protein
MELLIGAFIVFCVLGSLVSFVDQQRRRQDYHRTVKRLFKDSQAFSRQQKAMR